MLKAQAIGHLVADPELRYTSSGRPVCQVRLGCDAGRGPDGKPKSEFINVVVWDKQAEAVANYMTKGRLVYAEGRLQLRTYDKQDGSKGQTTEIVADTFTFLDRAKGEKEEAPLPQDE